MYKRQARDNIDQIICLGDCFSLGPEPEKTLETLNSIDNCIFIRGNHDRYIIEKLWEEELPTLEGMDPYDPICKAIVENEKWTAEKLGKPGIEFIRKMVISYRDVVGSTLVEFTHAWYQRDDHPPTIQEALNWKKHVSDKTPLPGIRVRQVNYQLSWNEGKNVYTYDADIYVNPN